MKKILMFLIAATLVISLSGCKKPADTPDPQPEDKGYTSFREETTEMTVEQAKTYLQEHADPTDPQYKEAIYTTVENEVEQIILEARAKDAETPAVKEVFSAILFQFREGADFADPIIRQKLFMRGNWAPAEEGWYSFTFIDTTLANTAVTMENDHALKEYTEVLELLLSDPNVTVKER